MLNKFLTGFYTYFNRPSFLEKTGWILKKINRFYQKSGHLSFALKPEKNWPITEAFASIFPIDRLKVN